MPKIYNIPVKWKNVISVERNSKFCEDGKALWKLPRSKKNIFDLLMVTKKDTVLFVQNKGTQEVCKSQHWRWTTTFKPASTVVHTESHNWNLLPWSVLNYNSIPGYSCVLDAVWGIREYIQRSDSPGDGSCMVLCTSTGSVECGVFSVLPDRLAINAPD